MGWWESIKGIEAQWPHGTARILDRNTLFHVSGYLEFKGAKGFVFHVVLPNGAYDGNYVFPLAQRLVEVYFDDPEREVLVVDDDWPNGPNTQTAPWLQ